METYGRIILMAMPFFFLLVLFEQWYGWRRNKQTVRTMDMISSLSSGITNATKEVLGLTIPILTYAWFLPKVQLIQLESKVWLYIVAFVVIDFAGYWMHRWSHHVNLLWNYHIIHHSSEDFNLACALRQSVSTFANPFMFLLIPAALVGVPMVVIATVAPLHLFAQFWYHTQHIGKMGKVIEYIFVTPSHHRVHHAINPEYLDKNMGQIFIIWDRLFGTFQEELADKPAAYGITRPVRTWNPIKINFQHLWLLIQDAWRTKSYKAKWLIWFKPTGWRPEDVVAKYPVPKIEQVYNFEKYAPKTSVALKVWSWVQLLLMLLAIAYLFGNIARIGSPDIFIYGIYVFVGVYAYTELMDRNCYAWLWEAAKNIFGLSIIVSSGDWFGVSRYLSIAPWCIAAYFVVATAMSIALVIRHRQEDKAATTPGYTALAH